MGKRYELGSTREIEFDDYLGQQGEVIGTESPGLSSSNRNSFGGVLHSLFWWTEFEVL